MVFAQQVSYACPVKTWWPGAFRFLSTHQLQSGKCWQVSSHGRCCNLAGVVSDGHLHPSGYRQVSISGCSFKVHRLVAFAFLGPPPSELAWQVHHRDGNSSNNHLNNLEYVTPRQNILYSYAKGSRRTGGPAQSKPVMWRAVGSQSWTTSPSMTHAAQQVGTDTFTVSKACRHGKSANGFDFQLVDCTESTVWVGEEWRQMYDPMSGTEVPGRRVSSLGRIQSQKGLISKGTKIKIGYFTTELSLASGRRSELVHRLVAFAFLGWPPLSLDRSYCQVNHKDGDKGNNAIENLEYVTPAENLAHYHANASSLPRQGKPVESRRHDRNDNNVNNDAWQWHGSASSAARALGLHASAISRCIRGHCHQAGGFTFRAAEAKITISYADEEWRKVDIEPHL